jgi:hypothetical protein
MKAWQLANIIVLAVTVTFQGSIMASQTTEERVREARRSWDFENVAVGRLPVGWKIEATKRKGPLATWEAIEDNAAPSGKRVVAMTSPNHTSRGTFNVFWTDSLSFLDGEVTTVFKALSGEIDQGGGVVWRVQDKDNYYIARFNPLEDNFRVYYVRDGKRKKLASVAISLPPRIWHSMKIAHHGQQIGGYLNGDKLLDVSDSTFTEPGGIGLWTKADAVTSFDDLTVRLYASAGKPLDSTEPRVARGPSGSLDLSLGTATPSEACGRCHKAIYREFAAGFGSDLQYRPVSYNSDKGELPTLPTNVSGTATLHALAGVDPFPIHAREVEKDGQSCNTCHFPEAFKMPDMEEVEIGKPRGRPKGLETSGITCASCHLTPEGKIRGPHEVESPHETVSQPEMRTSTMCAYCHAKGKRVVGKQTQTFLEWREDFYKPGLGTQHCQDCHMPRTLRKVAEGYDVPIRAVARHLWTGGSSKQRLGSALGTVIVQVEEGRSHLEFHIINIGAAHSVPTGSSRRAVYLKADIVTADDKAVASREWMFAPWYGNRPDDQAFLEEDKKRPDALTVMQADAQGPHEAPIRAGEERVLSWLPELKAGDYSVRTRLIYDLNRYNDKTLRHDQTEFHRVYLPVKVMYGE